jgi:hypothetical protein
MTSSGRFRRYRYDLDQQREVRVPMFSPELARTFQSDREREIREHVRVKGLLRAAKVHDEHVAARRTAPTQAPWPSTDRAASANPGTR